jgi:hypothetical protein
MTFDGKLDRVMGILERMLDLTVKRALACVGGEYMVPDPKNLTGDMRAAFTDLLVGRSIPDPSTKLYWLIERQAKPTYLGTWDRMRAFQWTDDHNKALAFATREQADGAMMAIRELVPALFPADIFFGPVEHGWVSVTPGETTAGAIPEDG